MVFHFAVLSGQGKTVTSTVKMSVETAAHAVPFQQIDDLLTAVSLIQGRVVEETVLLLLPRRLQGRLQPDQLPVEHLRRMIPFIQFIKPAAGPAQGNVPVEATVVMKQLKGIKFMFFEKRFILDAVFHQ